MENKDTEKSLKITEINPKNNRDNVNAKNNRDNINKISKASNPENNKEKVNPERSKVLNQDEIQGDINALYSKVLSENINQHLESRSNENEEKKKSFHLDIDFIRIKNKILQFLQFLKLNGYKPFKVFLGFLSGLFITFGFCLLFYAFFLSIYVMPTISSYYNEAHEVISNSSYETFRKEDNSYIYDNNGETLAKLKVDRNSNYLKYDDIPKNVINAFVAIEDRRFYEHKGVDLQSTAKAISLIILDKMGEPIETERGGSTITQQLVKTVFLTNEKTYQRKIKEIFMALEMEKKYSKEEILEFYVNNVYYYSNCYGIESASQTYYSKSVDELNLTEIATLCAIPNSPTYYNPVTNYDNNKVRRDLILKCMYEQGYINEKSYQNCINRDTKIKETKQEFFNYEVSYAIDCAVEYLMKQNGFDFKYSFKSMDAYEKYRKNYLEQYDLMRTKFFTGGYKVYTSIDLAAQRKLQNSVDSNLSFSKEKLDDGTYLIQGAATVIDNETGKVIAIVGGRTQESEIRTLNRGFQSYNQPGSTFKPLAVYTPAFQDGFNPDTVINDHEFEDGPSNSDNTYAGLITLERAIIESRNTVAWQVFDRITPEYGLSFVQNMNFSRIVPDDYYNASSLGGLTYGVNTLEMASGYATNENLGNFKAPTCIVSMKNNNDEEIYHDSQEKRVYAQYASKEITKILEDVIKKGTGRGLSLDNGMPSAGKTGTTNSQRSAWFCGFSPYYTISVWVGTDNNEEVENLWGATYPGEIWKDAMNDLCKGKEPINFNTSLTKEDLIEKNGGIEESTDEDLEESTEEYSESDTTEQNTDTSTIDLLVQLLYEYENFEISTYEDLSTLSDLENQIITLLDQIQNESYKTYYEQMYYDSKANVDRKIEEYFSSNDESSDSSAYEYDTTTDEYYTTEDEYNTTGEYGATDEYDATESTESTETLPNEDTSDDSFDLEDNNYGWIN